MRLWLQWVQPCWSLPRPQPLSHASLLAVAQPSSRVQIAGLNLPTLQDLQACHPLTSVQLNKWWKLLKCPKQWKDRNRKIICLLLQVLSDSAEPPTNQDVVLISLLTYYYILIILQDNDTYVCIWSVLEIFLGYLRLKNESRFSYFVVGRFSQKDAMSSWLCASKFQKNWMTAMTYSFSFSSLKLKPLWTHMCFLYTSCNFRDL